jgi:hypothetical protein
MSGCREIIAVETAKKPPTHTVTLSRFAKSEASRLTTKGRRDLNESTPVTAKGRHHTASNCSKTALSLRNALIVFF